MYGRVGRRKYKAGVKPRKITIGLLNHIKKFKTLSRVMGTTEGFKKEKGFPLQHCTSVILGSHPVNPRMPIIKHKVDLSIQLEK